MQQVIHKQVWNVVTLPIRSDTWDLLSNVLIFMPMPDIVHDQVYAKIHSIILGELKRWEHGETPRPVRYTVILL